MQVELEDKVLRMPSHLCRIQWQRSDGFQWAEPKSWIMLSADIENLIAAQLLVHGAGRACERIYLYMGANFCKTQRRTSESD